MEYTLEDVPMEKARERYPLLEQFCSSPCPQLVPVQTGDMVNYVLGGNAIGAESAVNIFAASVVRGGRPLFRAADEPAVRPCWSAGVNLPAKVQLMNILLHEDVWANGEPQRFVYDIRMRGLANSGDPAPELDRIESTESIQALGKGESRLRAREVSSHAEIVQYVCDQLDWDSHRLRGCRVRAQYPLLNAQHCIAFNPLPVG